MSNPSYMLKYDRWHPWERSSWPFEVLCQYEREMKRMEIAFTSASRYTFSHLKLDGAVWADPACKFLYTHNNSTITVQEWAASFGSFTNWTRLNLLMALSSYFETYIAAIVRQCIESDPGLLIKTPNSTDGIKLIKSGVCLDKDMLETQLINCTKGDWQSRICALSKLFPNLPAEFLDNISELEKMRTLRNKIGHAFGRDIDDSRDYANSQIKPMSTLNAKTFMRWQFLIKDLARKFDFMAMNCHIGNFQPLYHCHEMRSTLSAFPNKHKRMEVFKASLTTKTRYTIPDDFCFWVLTYYDNL